MKSNNNLQAVDMKKVLSISILFTLSILIIASGAFFSVYSVINNISFNVLNSSIHGSIFGLTVLYLGVKYFLSVKKLKDEVYKRTSEFSWSNFKKKKSQAAMLKSR